MNTFNVNDYGKKLTTVHSEDGYTLYEYCPTLAKPLLCKFEPMRLIRRLRFLMEYFGRGRYRVYYLAAGDRLVGHIVTAPGGRRLKCSTKDDIVIGPYYVAEGERGKGYAKTLIRLALERCTYSYNHAYDWIEKTNTASIRATEACGFTRVGQLKVVGVTRRLVITSEGDNYIYRYTKRS